MPVPVRVLAVDRSAAASESMCALLDAQPGIDCAGTAASAAEAHALWLAGREPADVVLVDRHLPDEDGLSLCLWLTTRAPAPAVVVHSPNADDALALPALVAGAAALATTPVTGGALAALVRAVAAGARPVAAAPAGADHAEALAAEDLPIVGMLRHGIPPAEVAETLGIDGAVLVARRWAMLEALTAAPERRTQPRAARAPHAMRTFSPSAATTSPGWS